MSKQNELAQLADAVTVDGSGNLDVTGTVTADGLTLGANNANSPQILFENSDGVTGDAALSTYDDSSGTMLVMGSNFYINSSGSETRFNASEESSAVMLNRNGDLNLLTGGTGATATTRLKIDSSGKVGIGDSSPSARLEIGGMAAGEQALLIESGRNDALSNGLARINITDANCPFAGLQIDHAGTGAAIIANGNVLVGTTNADPSFGTTTGSSLQPSGQTHHSSSGTSLILNRTASDGTIAQFRKAGTTIGALTAKSGDLAIHSTTTNHVGLVFGNTRIEPANNYGTTSNNTVDLGNTDRKFQDIYATNGTIQTSDFNEKQDIASLTATEMLVGKRISALFKTFRWKDSVAEKGGNARTHTGVIAQDVQAAFTAEGLDAGNYALFISTTWWEHDVDVPAVEAVAEVLDKDGNVTTEAVEAVDAYTRTDNYHVQAEAPEGATSKTRMGIRYPELLSFVAAYNEQRFASIEARLTALEA